MTPAEIEIEIETETYKRKKLIEALWIEYESRYPSMIGGNANRVWANLRDHETKQRYNDTAKEMYHVDYWEYNFTLICFMLAELDELDELGEI